MTDGKMSEEQEKLIQECFRKFEQMEEQLANLQRVRGVLDAFDDEMKSDPPAQPRPPVDVPAPSVEIRKDSDGGKK